MINIDSFKRAYRKFFGTRSDRELKLLQPTLQRVNSFEERFKGITDDELRGFTADFRNRLDNGADVDSLIPEAFAVVRETSRRVLGLRHYDVQILGGLVLHHGSVAEMKTGEGKTLCATLPVYLNALSGKGVHVITVNDYLASRDADWMGGIYRFHGMEVGKVLSTERNLQAKKAAYRADITYGTNSEFGFDYLRDNMKFSIEEYVQRGQHYAIVDEVDSILIDEARTPLIISGPVESSVERYYIIDGVIPLLQAEIDYVMDEKSRGVSLTDAGVDKIEQRLGVGNLYEVQNMQVLHHVDQALKAHTLFKRNRDYIVESSQVVIIDEHTGRKMPGRRWSDGLHQAIEAKEKVEIQPESQTYASITYQNYFRMYEKLAGMTGTAETEEEEFRKIYNLNVVVVPTNRPIVRDDSNDLIYKNTPEKYRAILSEIKESHKKGQPILVGTVSVEKSDMVSRLLMQQGIAHEVLNAKNHSREAEIVAQAGRLGAVTVSTNMAGRGTDIKLGGDFELLAKMEADPAIDPEGHKHALERFTSECLAEKEKVLAAGGLCIVGTERHESRRIDNQLRGRSGRQGDPGKSRFFLCFEDDLLRIFGSDKLIGWYERMGMKDDEPIEHSWVTSQIESAQKKVEGHNFNIRKNLLEYDDIMNLQRTTIYEMRKKALQGDGISEMINDSIKNLSEDIVAETMDPSIHPENWNLEKLRESLTTIFEINWSESDAELRDYAYEELRARIEEEGVELYREQEDQLGPEKMRFVEQMLLLQITDQYWKDHLLAMDRLRDGIGLRGYGQQNPLLEYKREGTEMFMLMTSLRDEAVISRLLQFTREEAERIQGISKGTAQRIAQASAQPAAPEGAMKMGFKAPSQEELASLAQRRQQMLKQQEQQRLAKEAAARQEEASRPEKGLAAKEYGLARNLSRNAPCPCGSGKKFKKCCMKVEA